jgi:BCD family chlorophyll transporter-like MFS transporter
VERGSLGPGLSVPTVPYTAVYLVEIVVLFATLAALGPLVVRRADRSAATDPVPAGFGLADVPA